MFLKKGSDFDFRKSSRTIENLHSVYFFKGLKEKMTQECYFYVKYLRIFFIIFKIDYNRNLGETRVWTARSLLAKKNIFISKERSQFEKNIRIAR